MWDAFITLPASLFPRGIWKYMAESEICFFLTYFEIQCFTTPKKCFIILGERFPVLNQQWGILVPNLSSSSFLDSSRNMDSFIRSTCSQPQMEHRPREMRPAMGSLSHHSAGVRFLWFVRFPPRKTAQTLVSLHIFVQQTLKSKTLRYLIASCYHLRFSKLLPPQKKKNIYILYTLLGINISHEKSLLRRWFSFSRLEGYVIVPWRVYNKASSQLQNMMPKSHH